MRSVPRRGIYVVRKTNTEAIELITAWAAFEKHGGAGLITENATTDEIASLRRLFATFEEKSPGGGTSTSIRWANIEFHRPSSA